MQDSTVYGRIQLQPEQFALVPQSTLLGCMEMDTTLTLLTSAVDKLERHNVASEASGAALLLSGLLAGVLMGILLTRKVLR